MFCTYCNASRMENEAPCPNCGAPSPLLGRAQVSGWGTGGPVSAAGGGIFPSQRAQWDYQVSQFPFSGAPSQVSQLSFGGTPSFAPKNTASQNIMQQSPAAGPPSLLPVPYQGGMGIQPQQLQPFPIQLEPQHTLQQMLPALPEESVYVPPMYTKPRAIIPRYRVISGLLSLLIVSVLICTGVGYYAQASGKIQALRNLIMSAPPPNLPVSGPANLPDPPQVTDKDRGPAYDTIPSATTASRIDPQQSIALQPDKVFKPGQTFYVTYSVQHPKQKGYVTVEWYANNVLFKTLKSTKPVDAGTAANGNTSMMYVIPAEGMVKLYWNNQWAQTLYFVVR